MSRLDLAIGVARSLAVYHAIPFRHRRMKRLYRRFVKPGDLAFDVGAHVGNRARALAALGCRVIALEPQPAFASLLRFALSYTARVEVVESAVSNAPGRAFLEVSERTPTVSTLVGAWRDERAREPGFDRVEWNRRVEVDVTTLDRLIERYGVPAFVKIDVEGAEPAVLAGLSRPIAAVSFEYLPDALDQVGACVRRLADLAAEVASTYVFNWSPGETYALASREWLSGEQLLEALKTVEARARSGDVYAALVAAGPATQLRPDNLAL